MNDIIAGDPAPTNPTARNELLLLDGSDEWPAVVDRILAKHRIEVLTEVADMLMEKGETPASLLVDQLREGGA
ncbi:hypothetical protein OG749_36030 [Streptomyces nojiriensis]|uniref:hypothetical protein n=1 Tax=Streptomyces nojiriensis TaxID=66374 RepID=UPI002E18D816